ncbi:undecaprenyldiphospho-muramoylpentapeptide beta-N-acetylglucosaminyltransferase [Flavobacteriaceae bacterium]|nr:undecaprenyldiphospho-muramoylpentapeptide beta-N-acetylglucosaminyltransferase [Flavobacteriaceae bacterium]MDC0354900.1 undecaprenyldiphospho-muramoylpentapeptide beta-N-acetylglucosaminyltransferase [Flavobacteriaceae bacterium]MDC0382674.1 undecaprenyldiphospho-muramoylpentapeptide beta-N-acetylglucosaminyltransferase [Flavobacteriaceae bacterium]
MKQNRFLISGGGTGGHIYPAISIAEELSAKFENNKILFVGSCDRMEMQKVPEYGYDIIGLWISGINRKLHFANLLVPLKVFLSIIKSYFIIKKFKPDFVVGTGGFASGPVLYVASKLKIPTLIQEQNSYPGITNRILSKSVNYICVSYPKMERYFPESKLLLTGNPVRKDIYVSTISKDISLEFFSLNKNKKTLLVLGGSLGALKINEFIKSNLNYFKKLGIQVLWQCGNNYFQQYQSFDSDIVKVKPFIKRMNYAYKVADYIVSRSGASVISELCIVGKPVIFIPSPNVAEDHQTKNAMSIVNLSSAEIVKEKDLDTEFNQVFEKIFTNEEYSLKLSNSIKKIEKPNATGDIVNHINSFLK